MDCIAPVHVRPRADIVIGKEFFYEILWKMNFYQREYTVFLLLAGPDAVDLWHLPIWTQFTQDLESYAHGARGKTAVRTIQYLSDGKTVSFGRLGWDDKSHAKWTHVDGNGQLPVLSC